MTRRHMEIFIAVTEEMNMSAAAQRLFISQSAVSQAIKDIETHYSIQCFERLSKKLFLTKAGDHLLSYARQINRLYQDLEVSVKQFEHYSPLRIGASVTVATSILPQFIKQFHLKFPGVEISVIEDNTSMVEKMVLEDQIDLGFVEGEVQSKDLTQMPILEDHLVFVCSVDHPFAGKTILPDQIGAENFILRELGSGTRKKFEETMKLHDISWQSQWTCNNSETIKATVVEGIGVTVISFRSVEALISQGALSTFNVEGIAFQRTFRLIEHKDKFKSKTLINLENFATNFYQPLDETNNIS